MTNHPMPPFEMPEFTQCSPEDLASRRQQLRHQRRLHLLQGIWRALAMVGLTAGVVMVATSPRWNLQAPTQIDISGNQLLSENAVYELLSIDYPQPLLKLQPQSIEQRLVEVGPIAEAVVSRRLFPPGLNVRINERHPVAISIPDTTTPVASLKEVVPFRQMGLLDKSGYWMPYNSFTQLNDDFEPPTLQVHGMKASYQKDWPGLFETLQQSPIKVTEIDWRDPSNLILQTDLGMVHMGPYGQRISEQLLALDRMRNLDAKLNLEKIAFIDLRDPQNPSVEILQATNTP
ncbi:MAG: FtsQ-type POTRA domain-containing protein [Cyanobacteria bacterium P01_D01_bin.44]